MPYVYPKGESPLLSASVIKSMERPTLPRRCMFCFEKIYKGHKLGTATMVRWDRRRILVHRICLRLSMLYQSLGEYSPARPKLLKVTTYKPPPNTAAGRKIRGLTAN